MSKRNRNDFYVAVAGMLSAVLFMFLLQQCVAVREPILEPTTDVEVQ